MQAAADQWSVLRFQHFAVLRNSDGAPWLLGRGAGGVTYKAVDTELQRVVALKVLSSDALESDEAKKLFRQEARAAAALRHPNLAAIHHFGEQDGECFYAMEFVEGKNLEDYVREHGPLAPDTALALAAQAASALGAAHHAGLVHRDVKPANLLLQEDAHGAAQVKLIDFGLATAASPGSASARSVHFSGTLLYTSPEQLDDHAVDPRSDLYSLGATLFYLLTGQPPFNGSLSQLVTLHAMEKPPVHVIPGSPSTAAAVVERLMAKKPQDRPASGVEACAEIEAARRQDQNGERITAAEWLTKRFAVLRRTGEIEGGTAYRAARQTGEAEIPVLFFDRTPEGAALAANFRQAARCLGRLTSPCIRQIESIVDVSDGVLVVYSPTVEAVRLLSVMRARRVLPVREALIVLQPLAAALDEAATAGLSLPFLGLRDVRLAPAQPSETPLDQWTGLLPVVDLLPLGPAQGHDAAATVVGTSLNHQMLPDASEELHPGQVIASLAYEMIGGMSAPRASHFVPLAELSAEGNRFLRRVFADPARVPSAAAVVQALQCEDNVSAATVPETPASRTTAPPRAGKKSRTAQPAGRESESLWTTPDSGASPSRAREWLEAAVVVLLVGALLVGTAAYWDLFPKGSGPSKREAPVKQESRPATADSGRSESASSPPNSDSLAAAQPAAIPMTIGLTTPAATTPEWLRLDGVSDEERRRDDKNFAIQGSRNSAVDRPEQTETAALDSPRSDDQARWAPGSSLKLVDLKISDGKENGVATKDLRFGIKARPGDPIDNRDVRIDVTFYEMIGGQVVPTSSRVRSMWLTHPADWQKEDAEILDVKYEVPLVGPSGEPPPEYYGYMVNTYFRGQLQESRASPVDLHLLFPPPLTEASPPESAPRIPQNKAAPPVAAIPPKPAPTARPSATVIPKAAPAPKPEAPRYIAVDVGNSASSPPGTKAQMIYDTKTGQLVDNKVYNVKQQPAPATAKPSQPKQTANQPIRVTTRLVAVETGPFPHSPPNTIQYMLFDTKTKRLGRTIYNVKRRAPLGSVVKFDGGSATVVGRRP